MKKHEIMRAWVIVSVFLVVIWTWPELAILPILFFFPNCTCCGPATTCGVCTDGLSTSSVQVVISGSASGFYDDVDGTYTVPAFACVSTVTCNTACGCCYEVVSGSVTVDVCVGCPSSTTVRVNAIGAGGIPSSSSWVNSSGPPCAGSVPINGANAGSTCVVS